MTEQKKELARVALKRRVVAVEPVEPYETPASTLRALGEGAGVEPLDLGRVRLPLRLLDLIPRETAEAHCLLPVLLEGDELSVVMASPGNKRVLEELEFVTGKTIQVFIAPSIDIQETIERAYLLFRRREEFFEGPRASTAPPASTAPDSLPMLPATLLEASSPEPLASVPPLPSPGRPIAESPEIPIEAGLQQLLSEQPVLDTELLNADDRSVDPKESVLQPAENVAQPSPSEPSPLVEIPDLDLRAPLEEKSQGLSGAGAAKPVDPRSGSRAMDSSQESSLKALVVEDDAAISVLIGQWLKSRGLKVSSASDGAIGLKLLKEIKPDLVILDAMLPQVHGFDIVRRMRSSETFRAVPIIIITAAHRGWEYAEDLRTTWGVNHYLEKPFEAERLLRAVDDALGKGAKDIDQGAAVALKQGIDAFKLGKLDAAGGHLEKGLGLDPLAYQLHFHMGLLHGKRGRGFEAISSIKQAVELNPGYFPAVKNLAILYLRAGFRRKSAEMWQRALGIAPDEATKVSIRQRIAGLDV